MVVYRGEGSYAVLKSTGDNTLVNKILEFTQKIEAGKASEDEIKEFAEKNFKNLQLHQRRFISSGMTKEAVLPYQKVIAWEEIVVPKGTKGAFIEPYCVERAKEAEFLMMDKMKIKITDAEYKIHNGKMKWVCKGEITPK